MRSDVTKTNVTTSQQQQQQRQQQRRLQIFGFVDPPADILTTDPLHVILYAPSETLLSL